MRSLVSSSDVATSSSPGMRARPRPAQAILRLQRRVGNRAVTSLLRASSARIDPSLSHATLAATTAGDIAWSPRAALLGTDELGAVARHELAHCVHQRVASSLAPADERPAARVRAESIAQRAERGVAVGISELLQPAPQTLTYEGTNYGPFPRVIVGNAGIIGEIVVDGVPIRVFRSYADLKIAKAPEHVEFECNAKHRKAPPIAKLVKRMEAVGEQVRKLNAMLPAGAAERVSLVAITDTEASRYAMTDAGAGMIILREPDPDDVAHEASHGVFEFHAGTSASPVRTPTPLALRAADLFDRLSRTRLVPVPTGRFDATRGKPGRLSADEKMPAGMAMVMDTLWAKIPGGHPGDDPAELFASALGLFNRHPALFTAIGDFYEKQDPALKPLRAELVTLLEAAGDDAKRKQLTPLGAAEHKQATQRIAAIKSSPIVGPNTIHNAILLALIDPTKLNQPASAPTCPAPPKPRAKPRP